MQNLIFKWKMFWIRRRIKKIAMQNFVEQLNFKLNLLYALIYGSAMVETKEIVDKKVLVEELINNSRRKK